MSLPTLFGRATAASAQHVHPELKTLAEDSDRIADLAFAVAAFTQRFKAHERIEADLVSEYLLPE